jgi:hypothetical protein
MIVIHMLVGVLCAVVDALVVFESGSKTTGILRTLGGEMHMDFSKFLFGGEDAAYVLRSNAARELEVFIVRATMDLDPEMIVAIENDAEQAMREEGPPKQARRPRHQPNVMQHVSQFVLDECEKCEQRLDPHQDVQKILETPPQLHRGVSGELSEQRAAEVAARCRHEKLLKRDVANVVCSSLAEQKRTPWAAGGPCGTTCHKHCCRWSSEQGGCESQSRPLREEKRRGGGRDWRQQLAWAICRRWLRVKSEPLAVCWCSARCGWLAWKLTSDVSAARCIPVADICLETSAVSSSSDSSS